MATYQSDFGGLWTDRDDAAEEIDRRLAAGEIDETKAGQLRTWLEKGYIVLEGAVDTDAIDRFRQDIVKAFEEGDDRLLIQHKAGEYKTLEAGMSTVRARVVDSYAYYPSARELVFAPAIVDWLRLVFEDDPMLFQSLSFDRGSQQGMHQDTAYVVVDSPLKFAASWIALEDIRPGSGELMYFEGSHRLPEYKFSGEHKHWNPERDGDEQHNEWGRLLYENAEKMGMERKTFLAKKGDVLIWAADLAHGGAPAEDENLTRRSLVGHYCPRSVKPNYFLYRDDRSTVMEYKGVAYFCSEHYDLSAADRPIASVDNVETVAQPAPAEQPPADPRPAATQTTLKRQGGLIGKLKSRFKR